MYWSNFATAWSLQDVRQVIRVANSCFGLVCISSFLKNVDEKFSFYNFAYNFCNSFYFLHFCYFSHQMLNFHNMLIYWFVLLEVFLNSTNQLQTEGVALYQGGSKGTLSDFCYLIFVVLLKFPTNLSKKNISKQFNLKISFAISQSFIHLSYLQGNINFSRFITRNP